MRQLRAGRACRALLCAALAASAAAAQAMDVRFQRVADGVYAFVGDKGARTPGNEGLNANIGLAVTPSGALLVDSGAFRPRRTADPRRGQGGDAAPALKWNASDRGPQTSKHLP